MSNIIRWTDLRNGTDWLFGGVKLKLVKVKCWPDLCNEIHSYLNAILNDFVHFQLTLSNRGRADTQYKHVPRRYSLLRRKISSLMLSGFSIAIDSRTMGN